jgi:translation initiation factor IF-3
MIKASPVRVIGAGGEQIGILPIKEALGRARDANLDLVEVAPDSRPPVCRILDFGKFKYEQSKKAREAKKKQHTVQLRSMRYRPKTDEHDFKFKTRHVREFLEQGSKVKVFVMFSGREMAHVEYGHKILERIIQELDDICTVEQIAKLEGRNLSMILTPKPQSQRTKSKRTQDAQSKNEPVSSQAVQKDSNREN